jgi:hypothetical protein
MLAVIAFFAWLVFLAVGCTFHGDCTLSVVPETPSFAVAASEDPPGGGTARQVFVLPAATPKVQP